MIHYKHLLAMLVTIMLMNGCGATDSSSSSDSSDSSSSSDDIAGNHNQGKDCIECHSNFTAAGTIFTKLNAVDKEDSAGAFNHTLKLALEEGTDMILTKGYGSGNAYTTTNTNTVGRFTAEVLDATGKVVNSSNAFSHDGDMLRCNRCHTGSGVNGAPGRITNFKL